MPSKLASYLFFAMLFGAGSVCAERPHTVLDPQTGSTLVIATQAWTFAREQPHLAAHARDYIALQAFEMNTAGKRRQFLAVFYWSTIERRGDFAGTAARVELTVDDRRITLSPAEGSLRDIGVSQWPLSPPGKGARLALYRVDPTLLRQLAEVRIATLRLLDDRDGDTEAVATWKDGRAALKDFIAEILD